MMIYYMRTDDLESITDALEAGHVVVVHQTPRYTYLKGIIPVAEVLGISLEDLPSTLRKYFIRKYVRRRVAMMLEDDTEHEEFVELALLPNDVKPDDEVIGEYEAVRFAGENS